MLARVPAATLLGIEGRAVLVEVHVAQGLPSFTVVGLPDAACRESRDRVRAAVLSSGFSWPQRRITVNLAPSGLRKGGAALDLAIAVGVLVASEVVASELISGCGFLGELGLDGAVRRVPGVISLVDAVPAGAVVVAAAAAGEARLVSDRLIRPVTSLRQLVDALRGAGEWAQPRGERPRIPVREPDLADVRGQAIGRWALEVAAAGGHHLLMVGPPGAGKTMLAERLPGLLPPLDHAQAMEVLRVQSAARTTGVPTLPTRPPFRAPHHSASAASLVGGGTSILRPGEISLANFGVLFLDELGEFPVMLLDQLRQPLEEGVIRICRAGGTATFPARFLLVAATNPCPCGSDEGPQSCRCADGAKLRYQRRLSGPLLDRFDLRVHVARPDIPQLLAGAPGESSAQVAERVAAARARARERGVTVNAELSGPGLARWAPLSKLAAKNLERFLSSGKLSARGLDRVRRVALTLADLRGEDVPLTDEQVGAALALRTSVFGEKVA